MRLYHGKAAWTRSIDNFSQNIYKVNSMHTQGISTLAIWYEGIGNLAKCRETLSEPRENRHTISIIDEKR